MAQLEVPGAVLNYEIWQGEGASEAQQSQGPWLTLINGHTRPLNDYRMLGKYMVAAGYRVLALDNRGAGKTEVTDDFTLADMAADVKALWQELGIKKSHVLGISMGGFIAQTLVLSLGAQSKEQIGKLVLVSTAPVLSFLPRDSKPWSRDVSEVMTKLKPYFTVDFAARNKLLVESMAKQIAKAVDDGNFAQRSEMQRRAIAGFDVVQRLPEITNPTMIVHGAEDDVISAEAAQALARGIRGARLELLPDAGHLLLAERPRELYKLVTEFLGA